MPNPTDGTTGNVCEAGGYCDLGSYQSTPCAPGTFNPDTGAQSEADCKACTPGYYCTGFDSGAGTDGFPDETG